MIKRLKIRFLNWLVRKMYCGLTDEDVFKVVGSSLFINGTKCTPEEQSLYKSRATKILDSGIWQDVKNKITFESNKMMFERSKGADDLFFGKAMIYSLDLIEKYLIKLSKLK